ncbi:MAG: heat-inducible transcriptional repressor HrcA [Lentilactobacillus hilgardii]|jgi:heat-inducible transcriptional repressor|uniref:heat-inducible transcriptional repressor HrcA n=2 Tax=Lentilactobacillus hilgardii TaxID=1588 RepID=UPI001CC203E1|nr:heat-inducible transcriptional repressor HrcA [Lentilactobacillus hilgardii]MCI1922801.1 heat-inducible transcriptional repressor HrcA [Lentilactobacillus buchneri]MBZ2201878.1 heat-inducible transcriptional repressor HrcA [Lentilactobacillus hilgardii]MBZ2204874.1 heat-inducible transcriptional repressor HrcA [Lentilactobacillus hilgardii]MCI1950411.1 heat-inducible transcriptional repressor HrcA [Lentilactobacillus buchneri]MCI2018560.1 heat-inducible transcriptional repressor HrcA [Lenti
MLVLTDRQKDILKIIIRDYTRTGMPVGSKALASEFPTHVSSATVRNDMAALESKGLITKTHFSSGRVPSMQGYRYYVDNLVQPDPLDDSAEDLIKSSFNIEFNRIDEIIQESAKVLSDLTSYMAVTFNPEPGNNLKLGGFRLVKLDDRQVMAIIVTNTGHVVDKIFRLTNVSSEQLETIVNIINSELVGKPISQVADKLRIDIPMLMTKYIQTPQGFLKIFGEMLSEAGRDKVHVDGKLNLLKFAERQNIDRLKPLYNLLDTEDTVQKIINPDSHDVQVRIGSELRNDLLKDYSIITGTYDLNEYGHGVIAVIGPTRMPYSKIIGIVGALREELTKKLLGYYDDDN